MADTKAQLEVEASVRQQLNKKLGQTFQKKRLQLSCGGYFEFDAVNENNSIVMNISTSGAITARGKFATGKMLKIRSDLYFLLLVDTDRRIMVLTERTMYDRCLKEQNNGRIPKSIEFMIVELSQELLDRLINSRNVASGEVSPKADL